MNTSPDIIDPVEKQFSETPEFGLVCHFDRFSLSSAIICLNKKDVQFTLTGEEVPVFLRVINGIGGHDDFCTLRPNRKSEVSAYVGLRVLQIGRFMIHFTDAELDRFRAYISAKFSPDYSLNMPETIS